MSTQKPGILEGEVVEEFPIVIMDQNAYSVVPEGWQPDVRREIDSVLAPLRQKALELRNRGANLASRLRSITVSDKETYELMAETLKETAEWKKDVGEFYKPFKTRAYELHRVISGGEKGVLDPVSVDELNGRNSLAAWTSEQERLRKKAETEAAESQRKLIDDAKVEAAQRSVALGASPEAAQEILDEPVSAPAPVVAQSYTKVAGVTTATVWKWRFEVGEMAGKKALIKAALKDERLLGYLLVNESALTSAAKALKSAASVPGIKFYSEQTTRVGGR